MHIAFEPLGALHPRWHHDWADLSVMAAAVVVPQIPGVCMGLIDRRVVRVDLSLELENHDAAAHQQDSIRPTQFHGQLVLKDGGACLDRLVHLHGLSHLSLE